MKPEVGVFQVFCTNSLQEEGRQKRQLAQRLQGAEMCYIVMGLLLFKH